METKVKKSIFESISLAMSEINGIGKNQVNVLQKYNFRGIDDAMNVVNPVMVKYKLVMVPKYELISTDCVDIKDSYGKDKKVTKVLIKGYFTFYAEDGSNIVVETFGEAFDYSDKAFNKAMATALKYCIFQTFMIPTEEKKDTENEHIELTEKTNKVEEAKKIEPKKKTKEDYKIEVEKTTTLTQLKELFTKIDQKIYNELELKPIFESHRKHIEDVAKKELEGAK